MACYKRCSKQRSYARMPRRWGWGVPKKPSFWELAAPPKMFLHKSHLFT
jgi:hypothetical protein